jgi:hypothetical protein
MLDKVGTFAPERRTIGGAPKGQSHEPCAKGLVNVRVHVNVNVPVNHDSETVVFGPEHVYVQVHEHVVVNSSLAPGWSRGA